jgi:hypothetical protein
MKSKKSKQASGHLAIAIEKIKEGKMEERLQQKL